jgi:hypothetical protein
MLAAAGFRQMRSRLALLLASRDGDAGSGRRSAGGAGIAVQAPPKRTNVLLLVVDDLTSRAR